MSIRTQTTRPSAAAASSRAGSSAELYEADFYAWTVQQGAHLRSGKLDHADLANIAEEIETLGRSERAALESAYRLIALHLLKLQVQPERTSRSWIATITRERLNATRLLRRNPGLEPSRAELFASAYQDARKEAAAETGLPLSAFPEVSSFDLASVGDETFFK